MNKYEIADLPVKVQIPQKKAMEYLSVVIIAFGHIAMAVGGWYILTGPDSISYFGSMSFKQFLQIYPGPIATLGIFLITIASYVNNASQGPQGDNLINAIEEHFSFKFNELSDNQKLYISGLGKGQYEVGIEEPSALSTV